MKLSDFVVQFIEDLGVKHVYLVAGGMMMHLMDSVSKSRKLDYICNHHEQACAMAAEGEQRVSGTIGVAMCTAGPGVTNMLTGTMGAWEDSIPVLFISGQANERWLVKDTGLRQLGVQEVETVKIVKPITKYAVTIIDPETIRYHMEKAVFLAKNGRPGPVWIDIPLDIQAKEVNAKGMVAFDARNEYPELFNLDKNIKTDTAKVVSLLKEAKRPVIVCGHGVRLTHSMDAFRSLVKRMDIPVICTKNAYDIIEYDNPRFMGMAGVYGYRSANFCIQAADLIIFLGSRIAITFTGYNPEFFASHAKVVAVDIDPAQLEHPTIKIDIPILTDVKVFIKELDTQVGSILPLKLDEWKTKCSYWKEAYPTVLPEYEKQKNSINAYYFLDYLSRHLGDNAVIVQDQGTSFIAPTQAMKIRNGQRMFTNGGLSSMGYGLPAAIGACFGNGKKAVICIHGDGGLQFNIQELQTIVHHKLPIKLFIFNNQGYTAIKHTMTSNFKTMAGCDPIRDLSMPGLSKISWAYGIAYEKIANSDELKVKLNRILDATGPMIIEVILDPMQPFVPKVTSYKRPDGTLVSRPLDDMFPFLDRETYEKESNYFKQ